MISHPVCIRRHHMERGNPDGVPGEPQEVHSWNQNDLRRHQKEGRAPGPDRLPEGGDIMNTLRQPEDGTFVCFFF